MLHYRFALEPPPEVRPKQKIMYLALPYKTYKTYGAYFTVSGIDFTQNVQ